ncbi:hypothetical protein [Novosphingobium capsulatum]|nr:hypothetical protein [Novosphingobium capsulatum]WQD91389.1 hypothetical protein U0041_10175 [Novosphingobium capsulatum]
MDWIVGLLIIGAVGWLIFRPKKSAPAAKIERAPALPRPPVYEGYRDELKRKPIEELDEDEQIIRRAHDTFKASQAARTAEYRAKQDALASDQNKIKRATDFIDTSNLDFALPFVQEETQYWPDWIVNQNGKWSPPLSVTDLAKGENGEPSRARWIELRPESGPLYRIEFEASRMPTDDDFEHGSMTLYFDGEEVLGMLVKRNWTNEWDRWKFAIVESLKVGPWIEGFIQFYTQLRSIKENKSEDTPNDYLRAKAAKIDMGGADRCWN